MPRQPTPGVAHDNPLDVLACSRPRDGPWKSRVVVESGFALYRVQCCKLLHTVPVVPCSDGDGGG